MTTSNGAELPADDPMSVCETCGGSGVDPEDFGRPFPVLSELRPCPDCDGRGEAY
jgi:DnaJ-class molecular chaperone